MDLGVNIRLRFMGLARNICGGIDLNFGALSKAKVLEFVDCALFLF